MLKGTRQKSHKHPFFRNDVKVEQQEAVTGCATALGLVVVRL